MLHATERYVSRLRSYRYLLLSETIDTAVQIANHSRGLPSYCDGLVALTVEGLGRLRLLDRTGRPMNQEQ